MKEQIYNYIANSDKTNFKKLKRKTNIKEDELKKIITELKLDGSILEIDNKYIKMPENYNIGTVIVSTSLKKYIEYNEEKISISSNFYNDIILNDLVCFKVNNNNQAEIITIVDRPLNTMSCEIVTIDNKNVIIPYHEGIKINLNKEDLKKFTDGDIILVTIPAGEIGEYYENKLIRKIGRRDDPLIQDKLIAINYGFGNDYTTDYLNEINNIPKEVTNNDLKNRKDFRNQNSFTIDGSYTKDMDDGVYAEKLDQDIIRVYVHIADVSHYIKKESLIFQRACEKGTSLYLNNSVFHMLHHIISNGICSLNPNVDRLTKTVILDIDKKGNIVNSDIVKSVINSKKKMTYEDVDLILNNITIPKGYENFIQELNLLNIASNRLEKKYKSKGRIDFANTELKMTYNDDGTIDKINTAIDSKAEKLIENIMICANETVARWLYYMEMPTIYRVHELPNEKKINELIKLLNKQGYHIRYVYNIANPEVIQIMIDKLKKYDGYKILSQLFVMTMQRAKYSTDNLGHYALSLPAYLHFTSPIRRLPDLIVHMICDIILCNYQELENLDFEELESKLKEHAQHASTRERLADAAEKEAEKRLIIEKLETLIGEELEATMCEIGEKIRIRLFEVDTYIDPDELGKYYLYDSTKKKYYNPVTKAYLSIGSKIKIKLTDVNKLNNSYSIEISEIENTKGKKLTRRMNITQKED